MSESNTKCLRAVLWDMDGVLVDSIDLHYQSWSNALADFGIPLTRQNFLKSFGLASADVSAMLIGPEFGPEMRTEIRRQKDVYFDSLVPQLARPMPGAQELVRRFSGHLQQAVASSSTLYQVTRMLAVIGLEGAFQEIVTSSEAPGKPDPAIFQIATRRLGVEPGNCLVIEDSPSGIEAARRAGITVIAICSTNPAESLSGANLVLTDLNQLATAHLRALYTTVPEMVSLPVPQ